MIILMVTWYADLTDSTCIVVPTLLNESANKILPSPQKAIPVLSPAVELDPQRHVCESQLVAEQECSRLAAQIYRFTSVWG